MTRPPHRCPACGDATIPGTMLVCRDCWDLVPYGLQHRLMQLWRRYSADRSVRASYARLAGEVIRTARERHRAQLKLAI